MNDGFNSSDHRLITCEIKGKKPSAKKMNSREWKAKYFDRKLFRVSLNTSPIIASNAEEEAEEVMKRVTAACDATMTRESSTNRHPSVYWWNDEIATFRKKCILARRAVLRSHRKGIRVSYVKAIEASKTKCCKELQQEVDSDPWGKPYKVVVKRLKMPDRKSPNSPMLLQRVVETLFPQRPIHHFRMEGNDGQETLPVTREELKMACKKMGNSKAPGLDGIPNIALQEAIKTAPDMFLSMYNRCL